MKSNKQIVGSGVVAMVACGLVVGCGSSDGAESTAAITSTPAAAAAPAAMSAPAAAESVALDLGNDTAVTFFALPAGGVALAERTAKGQPHVAIPMMEQEFTALETFRALAPAGTPEPAFLVREHQRASALRSATPSLAARPTLYGLVGTDGRNFDDCTATAWSTAHLGLTTSYNDRSSGFHTTAAALGGTLNLIGSYIKRRIDICNGANYDSYFRVTLMYRTGGGAWDSVSPWETVYQGDLLSFYSTGATDLRVTMNAPPAANPARPYVFGLGGAWTSSILTGP